MKIVYDHQIFSWQRYGGISRYFYELARHIAQQEAVNVEIRCPFYINEYLAADQRIKAKVCGRYVPLLVQRAGRIYRAANRLLVHSHRLNTDIVHETYYSYQPTYPGNGKIIITVHDMIHERYPESFHSWDSTVREKTAAVQRADHIICISENTRNDLIRFLQVAPEKISVVYHGSSLSARPNGVILEATPYILYVGHRNGYKNFDVLVQAFASSHFLHSNFAIIAFGSSPLSPLERARIHTLGHGRIKVRHISGDDQVLANLYAQAAAFVYPSKYEGFGLPLLEAMICQCPVLCANRSSLPEVAESAAAFFDPDSSDALVDTLQQVLDRPMYRQDLIERGLQRAKFFSWHKCAQETLAVYRTVLA